MKDHSFLFHQTRLKALAQAKEDANEALEGINKLSAQIAHLSEAFSESGSLGDDGNELESRENQDLKNLVLRSGAQLHSPSTKSKSIEGRSLFPLKKELFDPKIRQIRK